jgi:sialic acid synthase SpsE
MNKFKIGETWIGDGCPLYFIADIGANHDGELQRAFDLIELAKESGANAAKFQNFKAHSIVSSKGFSQLDTRVSHQLEWSESVYEIYEKASISYEWTSKIKEKCTDVGIDYFTSPYDFESVDHVNPFLEVFKIGSGDITWLEIIAYIAKKNKPVLLATGASSMEDVDRAMSELGKYASDIVLMQCNTNYTASPENFKYINLNVLKKYRGKYPNAILGLSDHTPGYSTVLGAIALGATVFEKHFTDDNDRQGPDHKFAMNPKSWSEMINSSNELLLSLGDGIKRIEANESETKIVQRRALRYASDFKRGTVITKRDLVAVRPCLQNAIPPYLIDQILGLKLGVDVDIDELVKYEDFRND